MKWDICHRVANLNLWKWVFRLLWSGLLGLSLAACGGLGGAPPQALIEQAVSQEFAQTQQMLWQQLSGGSVPSTLETSNLKISNLEISKVKVDLTQPVILAGGRAYQVQGTYTLQGKYLNRTLRQARNPFEVYVQRGPDQTWNLLELEPSSTEGGEPSWRSIPLLPGD